MLTDAAAIRELVAELCAVARPLAAGNFIVVAEHPERDFSRHVRRISASNGAFDHLLRAVLDFACEYPAAEGWTVRLISQVVRSRDIREPAAIGDGWGRNMLPQQHKRRFGTLCARLGDALRRPRI